MIKVEMQFQERQQVLDLIHLIKAGIRDRKRKTNPANLNTFLVVKHDARRQLKALYEAIGEELHDG